VVWGCRLAGAQEDSAEAMGRCAGYLGVRERVCAGACQSRLGEWLASGIVP
jgi:hypothetical protein